MNQPHPVSKAGVWFAVKSSNLAEYRYDPKAKHFDVKFKGNPTAYRYLGVELETANAFVASDKEETGVSKGEYFSREIKPKHEFLKLSPEEAI